MGRSNISVPREYAADDATAAAWIAGYSAGRCATITAPTRPKKAAKAKVGVPEWSWPANVAGGYSTGNVSGMLLAREAALRAQGWTPGAADAEGYRPRLRGAERLRLGPWGAVYLGAEGWAQMPREQRDVLTLAGREIIVAAG